MSSNTRPTTSRVRPRSSTPRRSSWGRWSGAVIVAVLAMILLQWMRAGTVPEDLAETGIKNVLVLTAHPDDEVMFFAPAILHLLAAGAHIHGLCLSSGNADGLGERRKDEILGAYARLGVPVSQVTLIDDPVLPDGMHTAWNPAYIATKTAALIYDHSIDAVITFDATGVSSHPNHISLHTAMRAYLTRSLGREAQDRRNGNEAQPRLLDPVIYALRTPPLMRKYLGLPGALYSHAQAVRRQSSRIGSNDKDHDKDWPDQLAFLSSPTQYVRTLLAMRSHASQLVWFRYLYVLFSVLMFGGQLERVQVMRPRAMASSAQGGGSGSAGARSAAGAGSVPTGAAASVPPLIPLSLVDGPSQRYYAASFFAAVQAYKAYCLLAQWWAEGSVTSLLPRALVFDAGLLYLLYTLKIPRLSPPLRTWLIFLGLLALLDLLLTGWAHGMFFAVTAGFGRWFFQLFLPDGLFSGQLGLTERQVRVRDLISPSSHIFGQHTVHILPHSTAKFRAVGQGASSCYCIGPAQPRINIPITFNNTDPVQIQYSVTSFLNSSDTRIFSVDVSRSALHSASGAGHGADGGAGGGDSQRQILYENDGDVDLDDLELLGLDVSNGAVVRAGDGVRQKAKGRSARGASELLFELPIQHVGRIRLERVVDRQQMDARISASEILVVECPTTRFADMKQGEGEGGLLALTKRKSAAALVKHASGASSIAHYCPGDEAQLFVDLRGTAPLQLTYHRLWDARIGEEGLTLPHGQADHEEHPNQQISRIAPTGLNTPLVAYDQLAQSEGWDRQLFTIVQEQARRARAASESAVSFDWATSKDVRIPLNLDLTRPGTYSYELASVRDACGNLHVLQGDDARSKKVVQEQRSIEVHQPAKFAFTGCVPEEPIKLKRDRPNSLNFSVKVIGGHTTSAPWDVTVAFSPDTALDAAVSTSAAWTRNFTVKPRDRKLTFDATGPGTYTLEKASGRYCPGEIGAPWICSIVDVPMPTANISFSSIDDICAGPVGVKALAIVNGAPPFTLRGTQISGRNRRTFERTFTHSREEIDFKPSSEGSVEYVFESLSDANYQDLKIDGPRHRQVVHPLASASFDASASEGRRGEGGAPNHIELRSCTGDTAAYDVLLRGTGPYDLTYAISSGSEKGAPKPQTVKGITDSRYKLEIALPKEVAKRGGKVTASLVSVKDAKGCERPLTTSDLVIDVRRIKPTAAFFPPEARLREVVKLEDHDVELPIRLSGDGPWKVGIQHELETKPTIHKFSSAESQIKVRKAGVYTLTSVEDDCPGSVLTGRETYVIRVRERPSVRFTDDSGILAKNQSLLRRPVCVGTADAATVTVQGHSPIHYSWQQHVPSSRSNGYQTDRLQAASAQNESSFQVLTGTPGWHIYELLDVSDALYEAKTLSNDAAGKVLEQFIHPLPSASVQQVKDLSFCVGDTLDGRAKSTKSQPAVNSVGTPPFAFDFEITHESTGAVQTFHRSDIGSHRSLIDLSPAEFNFSSTGTWRLTLLKVVDGNGCQTVLEGGRQGKGSSVVMEVAETASIASVGDRDDYCVGESVDFLLQGNPPWMVEYEFNGKKLKASSKEATFVRIADRPGKLVVQRVAHQRNKCQQDVSGLVKTIHQLPTVRVREGKHYIENLREGNQAEIVFTLTGVPPFSFTYQRTETSDDHAHPKVLETHTEGTWSVTFLQDRHCAVDAQGDAPRLLGKAKLAIEPAP
ncbi:unnamed protein product [Tilletia controversa]|nr:unnamed protein product [Tilletia controversa]